MGVEPGHRGEDEDFRAEGDEHVAEPHQDARRGVAPLVAEELLLVRLPGPESFGDHREDERGDRVVDEVAHPFISMVRRSNSRLARRSKVRTAEPSSRTPIMERTMPCIE